MMSLLARRRDPRSLARLLILAPPHRLASTTSAASASRVGADAAHAANADADADDGPSTGTSTSNTAAPAPSPLARELRGWLRYISPLSPFSATFYRTDGAIADRAVGLALEEVLRTRRRRQGRQHAAGGGGDGATLVDLGCGDGAIMLAALRAHPGKLSRVVGYELCAELAAEARRRCEAKLAAAAAAAAAAGGGGPSSTAEVIEGDARDADLSEADAVFLYMSARANAQLLGPGPAAAAEDAAGRPAAKKTRSARTLRTGCCVASLGFPVEGWDAWQVSERALQAGRGGGVVPFYLYVAGGGGVER